MKRLFHLFSKESSVRGASIILVVTYTLSNILGLFRDRYLAANVSTYYRDVYFASFRIPDTIFNILILGAISSAFIPIFSDFIAKKEENHGFDFANRLINLAIISVGISALLLTIFMPYLTPLLVYGFDPGKMAEVTKYSRILMLLPIFFSLSYITGGILNSYKYFWAYAVAPLIYNLAIIFGAVFLAPRYGLNGVAFAVVIGSALHFLIQVPSAIKLGYRYNPIMSIKDKSIKLMLRLMVPRSIGMGANQVMLLFFTSIGSALASGTISAFSYANNIQTMPVAALGSTFATAIFPTLTQKISQGKDEEFAFYLNRSLRVIGYLLIPSTAIFVLLRVQIVRLILGSRNFSWDDTRMTALALGFLSLSILAQGLIPLLSRAFYALKDTRTPMYIGIATVIVSVILAYPLARTMHISGLALAFSIGSYFNVIALVYYLKRIYPHIIDRSFLISYFKTTLISLAMAVVIHFLLPVVAGYVNMNRFSGIFIQTTVVTVIGVIIFLVLSYITKQEEMKWAFTRKINDKPKN